MASKKASLQQRLLQDIAEFHSKPYPCIQLIPNESNLYKACLILTPDHHAPIHLSMAIPANFPIRPPTISCDTTIRHPNIFGKYICASILDTKNTKEGYTPAYTLKGVAIQMLSFFTSESLEQSDGREEIINLKDYSTSRTDRQPTIKHVCRICQFGTGDPQDPSLNSFCSPMTPNQAGVRSPTPACAPASTVLEGPITKMSDEILALLCQHLEDEELANFSRSWNRIGEADGIVARFNIVRNRELNCFVLKKSFQETQLGVGVRVKSQGKNGNISSEFDLISRDAFQQHQIRTSVQGIGFSHWIPLPLSRRHYDRIQPQVNTRLEAIGIAANISASSPAAIIYHFMNDVVVKLSDTASPNPYGVDGKTTLRHASEKAIESYFHLFHLLLCVATSDRSVVEDANVTLQNFLDGQTSKTHCPNLGHLLLAALIADFDITQPFLMAMIEEVVTRNVVWMLDKRGANMADLAYFETDAVCEHRLAKTFEASKTSYRLLMFFNLFRGTIARGTGADRRPLPTMLDQLFDAHGAPPFGAAAKLAAQVKDVQEVDDFFSFMSVMEITNTPTRQQLTKLMRDCVEASIRVGYTVWGITQADAKRLRMGADPSAATITSFFPSYNNTDACRGGQGVRGGRGVSRGHG